MDGLNQIGGLNMPKLRDLVRVVTPMNREEFARFLGIDLNAPRAPRQTGNFQGCGKSCQNTGGWMRKDVPIDHPDFGKAFPCPCRAQMQQATVTAAMNNMNKGMSNEMRGWTFENSPADPNAVEVARLVSEQPFGMVVFWSREYGTGKTGLLSLVVNACNAQYLPALYVSVPDLLDELRASYYDNSFEERVEFLQTVRVLALDEFHFWHKAQHSKNDDVNWASEKLFRIIDHRYRFAKELLTVIATNADPLAQGDRFASRFSDSEHARVIRVEGGDLRPTIREWNT